MSYRLVALVIVLVFPAIAAAPRTLVSDCNMQMRIYDGRNPEGVPIPGQSADLILPCVTKEELASIIKDFSKSKPERMDLALDALRRAKGKVRMMVTTDVATHEQD